MSKPGRMTSEIKAQAKREKLITKLESDANTAKSVMENMLPRGYHGEIMNAMKGNQDGPIEDFWHPIGTKNDKRYSAVALKITRDYPRGKIEHIATLGFGQFAQGGAFKASKNLLTVHNVDPFYHTTMRDFAKAVSERTLTPIEIRYITRESLGVARPGFVARKNAALEKIKSALGAIKKATKK